MIGIRILVKKTSTGESIWIRIFIPVNTKYLGELDQKISIDH